MDEIQKLEYLSLVSKICTELDNHYGLNDKDLGNCMLLSFSELDFLWTREECYTFVLRITKH